MEKAQVNVRVDAEAKKSADAVLRRIGINFSDAVNMFVNQINMVQGIPFEPKIPNAKTRAAMKELDEGGGTRMTMEEFRKMLKEIQKSGGIGDEEE